MAVLCGYLPRIARRHLLVVGGGNGAWRDINRSATLDRGARREIHQGLTVRKLASSSTSITVGRLARAAVCSSSRRCWRLETRSARQPKPLAKARKSGV